MKRLLIPDELLPIKRNKIDFHRTSDEFLRESAAKSKERTSVTDREIPNRINNNMSPDDSQNVYSFASSPESLIDFYESIIDDLHTLKVAVNASYEDAII